DGEGNAVSLTYSLNTLFGCKQVVDGAGFLLNSTIDDFQLTDGVPNHYGLIETGKNRLRPGRRPVGSMAPTLVVSDAGVEATIGASGGPRICTLIVQVLLGMFGDGLPLAQALQAPRVHHQFKPDDIHIEEFVDPDVIRELEARGYPVIVYPRLGIGAGIHRLSDDKL